jgi:hypothetical protein
MQSPEWRRAAAPLPAGGSLPGSEPPTDGVMPPMDELVRVFAEYGCEILGPPLSLSDVS